MILRESYDCEVEYVQWLQEQKNKAFDEYLEYESKLRKQRKILNDTVAEMKSLGIEPQGEL